MQKIPVREAQVMVFYANAVQNTSSFLIVSDVTVYQQGANRQPVPVARIHDETDPADHRSTVITTADKVIHYPSHCSSPRIYAVKR